MYAIRQISTGWWMPQFGKNQSKGGTWLEPKADCVPRLFRRKQDAKIALDWWLGGRVQTHYDYEGEFSDISRKKVPERNTEDMEIVKVCICEIVEKLA